MSGRSGEDVGCNGRWSLWAWRRSVFSSLGQFALFTYVRPFLETVSHVDVSTLSLVLLLIGVAGFIGTSLIGVFLKDGLYRTLIFIPVAMAGSAVTLTVCGAHLAITTMLLGVWGLICTAASVGWWTWLARSLPEDAEAGGGLMVAVIQLAITLVPSSAARCSIPAAIRRPLWPARRCC